MSASQIMLNLPGILRGAGCEVVEYDGWRDRGRPYAFTPRGVILHHDGSPKGPAQPPEAYAHFLFVVGRPSEGIPAPLCNCWIDYYGRWWIGAAGRANHAGVGTGWGVFPRDAGNQSGIGVEMDNTSDEPTTPDQYEALHVGLPAIFAANGWDPANALGSHKEYAPGRKFDPDDIDMPALRSYVSLHLHDDGKDWFDMATKDELAAVVRDQLNAGTAQGLPNWAETNKYVVDRLLRPIYNTTNATALDVAALRADFEAVIAGLPPGSSAEEIANAVADELAKRLTPAP